MEYIASISYGKDSLAMLEAITLLKKPLDRIVTAEVWATDDIQADLPPMVEFKDKADKIIKERYGIDVEHFYAKKKVKENSLEISRDSLVNESRGVSNLKSVAEQKVTYQDLFYRVRQKGSRGGKYKDSQSASPEGIIVQDSNRFPLKQIYGFPMMKVNWCTGKLKNAALKKSQSHGSEVVSYIGIASDEPERIERHSKRKNIEMPLVEIGWDEAYCRKWCEENDLLSPIYTTSARGGCWFCHNQGVGQLRLLRRNYPDLWALLMKWDLDSPVSFHADGHTVHDFDRRFEAEDKGFIDPNARFHWADLDDMQTNIFQFFDKKGNYKGDYT